jgi:hypothetical protein
MTDERHLRNVLRDAMDRLRGAVYHCTTNVKLIEDYTDTKENIDVDAVDTCCDRLVYLAGLIKENTQCLREIYANLPLPDDSPPPIVKTHQPTPD